MRTRRFDVCLLFTTAIACGPPNDVRPAVGEARPAAAPSTQDPWPACQQAFADAEQRFRSRAPGLYEPYRTLNWQTAGEDEDGLVPPEVRAFSIVAPGRSWFFMAAASDASVFLETSVPRMGFAPRFLGPWHEQDNEEGYAIARSQGERAAVVWVDTDRPGEFDVRDHPLTRAFVAEFKTAANACLEDGTSQ